MTVNVCFFLPPETEQIHDPLYMVCLLTQQAYKSSKLILILTESSAQMEVLDNLLWSFEPDSYLAHQVINGVDDDRAPILLTTTETIPTYRPLIINLSTKPILTNASGIIQTIYEIIPTNPEARATSRLHWKEYQSHGYHVEKTNLLFTS